MMYCEFVAGTGCKDTPKNYEVFKNLEAMYMNTDMSKAEIYEYGKKLVDNSKTEAELKIEAQVKAEIDECKDRIAYCKREISYREDMVRMWTESGDKNMAKMDRNYIAYLKGEIKTARNRIAACKWVLGC